MFFSMSLILLSGSCSSDVTYPVDAGERTIGPNDECADILVSKYEDDNVNISRNYSEFYQCSSAIGELGDDCRDFLTEGGGAQIDRQACWFELRSIYKHVVEEDPIYWPVQYMLKDARMRLRPVQDEN